VVAPLELDMVEQDEKVRVEHPVEVAQPRQEVRLVNGDEHAAPFGIDACRLQIHSCGPWRGGWSGWTRDWLASATVAYSPRPKVASRPTFPVAHGYKSSRPARSPAFAHPRRPPGRRDPGSLPGPCRHPRRHRLT